MKSTTKLALCALLLSGLAACGSRSSGGGSGGDGLYEPIRETRSSPSSSTTSASGEAREVLRFVNAERAHAGLPPLSWDSGVARAAQSHADDMARRGYFDHETPEGVTVSERVGRAGIKGFSAVAENLALGQRSASQVVSDWMQSNGHRRNMLRSTYAQAGVGVADGPGGRRWVLVFLKR